MTNKKIILEEIGRIRELMGFNGNSMSVISEGNGTKGIIDEIIPGGAKTMDNLGKLSKTVDDLFAYSTRLSELAPTKSFDDFLAVVSKKNNNQEVTADMVRRFIASDAKLTDELMGAASKISEEAVRKLMQNVKFTDVFTKAGMADLPETMKGILGTKINSGSSSQVKAGLDSMEDIIKSTNLKDTVEGKELLDQIVGKRKQIGDYEDLQTKSTVNTNDPQSYLKGLSEEQLLSKLNNNGKINSRGWYDFGPGFRPEEMSGWKFHIFGETLDDSAFLIEKLKPIADKYNASSKVGGLSQVNSPGMKPGTNQYGKQGVCMYIPSSVVKSGKQQDMLMEIQNAISGYKKGGTITGDQAITPSIHYRYELNGPIKEGDIKTYDDYTLRYNQNSGGPYKPNDVNDLFSSTTNKSTNNITNTVNNGFLSSKFGDTSKINWTNITYAKNMSDYDVIIDNAMKTGNFNSVSRSGFEDYGIPNFRKYLMDIYNK